MCDDDKISIYGRGSSEDNRLTHGGLSNITGLSPDSDDKMSQIAASKEVVEF